MIAKIQLTNIQRDTSTDGHVYGERLTFRAVGGDAVENGYPQDGKDEDNSFARWTPSAELGMQISNPELFGKFAVGEKFYLNFTKAVAMLLFVILSFTSSAQTTSNILASLPVVGTPTNYVANPPTIQSSVQGLADALANGVTNWYIGVYGLYAPKLQKHLGFGFGAAYPLSEYVITTVRIDYINGGFWMPSGNATLQIPISIPVPASITTNKIMLTPFAYAGVGIPVGGASGNNGQATGILGTGAVLNLWTSSTPSPKWYSIDSVKLVGDIEKWGGFDGNQYRLGLFINKKL